MDLDYGRKLDLEELMKARSEARSSSEKEHYERLMSQILTESPEIRQWRDRLLRAVRIGDKAGAQRIVEKIQSIRLEETHGESWGSSRGNKNGW